jgi:hypothetical protein
MNLKVIEGGKAVWQVMNHTDTNATPTEVDLFGMANVIREKPICPFGGAYTIGSVGEKPRCSIPGHTL